MASLVKLPYNVIKRSIGPVPVSAESALVAQIIIKSAPREVLVAMAKNLAYSTGRSMKGAVLSGLSMVPLMPRMRGEEPAPSGAQLSPSQSKSRPDPESTVLANQPFHMTLIKSVIKIVSKLILNILLELIVVALKAIG
jgi:hypothetical protein